LIYRIILVLVLLILSFIGGIYYTRLDDSITGKLSSQVQALQQQNQELNDKNLQQKEILQLVKRQVQTDRIAYQTLQDALNASEQQQREQSAQLEKQRELLKLLRMKLE
jgi:hypothetical protein